MVAMFAVSALADNFSDIRFPSILVILTIFHYESNLVACHGQSAVLDNSFSNIQIPYPIDGTLILTTHCLTKYERLMCGREQHHDVINDDDAAGIIIYPLLYLPTGSGGAPDAESAARLVVRSGADLQTKPPATAAEKTEKARPAPESIWDPDEVTEGAELDDTDDPRPQPEYSMNFRQEVGAEDVFLQVGIADRTWEALGMV